MCSFIFVYWNKKTEYPAEVCLNSALGVAEAVPQRRPKREFPKIGDPNIVPEIVGSLLKRPPNKVPLFSETPKERPYILHSVGACTDSAACKTSARPLPNPCPGFVLPSK